MPKIYLGKTKASYLTTSLVRVNVSNENYTPSKLFNRLKHELEFAMTGDIWIYKKSFVIKTYFIRSLLFPKFNLGSDYTENYLTIKSDENYKEAKLEHADVYVNKFDDKKTPLVLVLIFNNEQSQKVENKYYILNNLESKIQSKAVVPLYELNDYEREQDILDDLLKENDNITNILTYDIGRSGGEEGDTPDGNYNGGKICVQDDTSTGQPTLSENGFKRYKHTPVSSHGDKKACVIYDKNVLVGTGQEELSGIQGEVYTSIVVYFGSKAKKTSLVGGSSQIDVPLLIELTKKTTPRDPEYYVHKRKSNTGGSPEYYWEALPGIRGGTVLSDLLEDMGFGMSNSENGYNELKGILSGASVSVADGVDLSTKVGEVKGSQLQKLLEQQVGQGDGLSQKTFLQLLLTQIEFDLLDSVVILLYKKPSDGSQYGESEVSSAVGKLVPPKEINTIDMSGKNITVSNATEEKGECVKPFGYKLISHNFGGLVSSGLGQQGQSQLGIRFIIPSESSDSQYKQLKLYSNDKPEPQNLQYTYYDNSNKDVYVYFYGEDPRPLMVCYNDCAYKPRNLDNTDKETQVKVDYSRWEKVATISKCTCSGADTGGPNQKILKALNEVTGFLNPVQINPNEIPSGASGTITGKTGTSATYELHTYNTKTIKMGITREDVGCYDKYTYQPYGINGGGSRADGYRLGNVIHTKTRQSGSHSPLKYTTLGSESNKYHPLVGVTVYYYDEDKQYADPLLIELEFKNGVGNGGTNPKEYYKLNPGDGGGSNGTTLKWAIDTNAQSAVISPGNNNQKLIAHLDSIRHSLKPVIKILLDKQSQYGLCVSQQPGGNGGYNPAPGGGGKQIEVNECSDDNGCTELKAAGYVCFVHKVSTIANGGSGPFDYNTIGGLKFFISGKNGEGAGVEKDIEIKLHTNGNSGDSPVNPVTYNTCMGDVYVYFYCKKGSDKPDTVPLMLQYNSKFYSPEDGDEYFNNWDEESSLKVVTAPCGGDPGGHEQLAANLDRVNAALNRINLTHNIDRGSTSEYGIPIDTPPPKKEPKIDVNRVDVTKIPSKDQTNRPYRKIVHRTSNGFTIGDIYYKDTDITVGVTINGSGPGGSISISGDSHTTKFVTSGGSNKPNTVVAYYHTEDTSYTLPQLIVLMETTDEISPDQTITAKPDTKYGYYVLATNGNGGGPNNYKYEWREPEESMGEFKLDDPTEFLLLNSVVVLVDQQQKYQEDPIQKAVKTLQNKSPGNSGDVNRLKNKDITPKDVTETSGKCVSKYGYKLFDHDLTTVTAKIFEIEPILGLRFLIPSSDVSDYYDEISLFQDKDAEQPVGPLYHTSANNTVYVFFYGQDPRPLLLCYGNDSYIPQKLGEPEKETQVSVDYTIWTKVDGINKCVCEKNAADNSNKILDTLLEVALFLNPVQINPKQIPNQASSQIIPTEPPKPTTPKDATYELHQFTPKKTVQMKITRDDVKCYEKYTYEPNGTSSSGTGFRLGTIIYTGKNNSIKTLDYPNEIAFLYDPLVKVTVYYYDHDKQYEDPLLIQLDFKINIGGDRIIDYKEYYKLSKVGDATTNVDWQLDPHGKDQIGQGEQEKLINYLDKIRYQFKKVLQVCIAFKQKGEYKANLLNKDNGPAAESNEQINVQVTEESDSGSISGTGFRCFKHEITKVGSPNLHKIGALQFLIPTRDTTDQVKLNLYGTPRTGLLNQLYYNCGMGDIYVFFYGGNDDSGGHQYEGDPRPLLLCYNNKAFRALSMVDYDEHTWKLIQGITDCLTNGNNILESLVCVSNFLNPLNIKMDQFNSENTGTYKIHKFNGHDINIKVTKKSGSEGFCYTSYTHKHEKEGFRLGRIDYGSDTQGARSSKCIQLSNHDSSSRNGDGSCINAELDEPKGQYKSASQVIVYYFSKDTSHEIPLLVVLCSETNLTNSKQYYELQRTTDSNEPKKYKKEKTALDLNPSKNGQLERLLDKKLSGMSKSLQIILGKRLDPIQLCPIERKRIKLLKTKKPLDQLSYEDIGLQLLTNALFGAAEISQAVLKEPILSSKPPNSYEYINENDCTTREKQEFDLKITTRIPSYPARVYKNDGIREQGPSGTALIKVQKMEVPGLSDKGYVCYKHKLLNIPNINEFNGLRLFLWDNRNSNDDDDSQCKPTPPSINTKHKCCELDLYEDGSQPSGSCSTSTKIEPIAYTTCKGDLYVYFYGSDPRPMLLCYN